MITVYHLKALTAEERARLNGPNGGWDSEPRFARYADVGLGRLTSCREAWHRGEYERVATVDCDGLELAYMLTNHIDDSWHETDDRRVNPYVLNPRSSSVGDVFVRDGEAYVCSPIGFEPFGLKVAA